MQSGLQFPPTPKLYFSLYYQDVPSLQLAKCTYVGMRAKNRRKSGHGQFLIFSEENPNCALRAAVRGEFHPSRRCRRAQKVPRISPTWAQNGPKSADFEGVPGGY